MGAEGSQALAAAKDLELLRAEDKNLSDQIASASLIRLVLLFLITCLFLLGTVKETDDTAGIKDLIETIQSAESRFLPGQPHQPIDPFTLLFVDPSWLQIPDAKPGSPPEDTPPDLSALSRTLKEKYIQLFDSKLSFVGADIHVDLRMLIITLPAWLLVAYIYIRVLRYKHQALAAVCQWRFQNTPKDQLATVDLLLFTTNVSRNAYRRYPAALGDFSFWIIFLILILTIVDITWASLRTIDETVVWAILFNALAATAFYGRAYCYLVGRKLARQVYDTFQCPPPRDFIGRAFELGAAFFRWVQKRPRFPLTLGSVFILATVFLNSAQVGCRSGTGPPAPSGKSSTPSPAAKKAPEAPRYQPGYALLTGQADWPPSIAFFFESVDFFENILGRLMYAITLALAVATLACVLASFRRGFSRRIISPLVIVSVIISVYLIANYSSAHLLGVFRLWMVPWALTVILWLILARSRKPHRAARWHRIREIAILAFVPICLADLTFMVTVINHLPGLAVLYAGAHMVALGWLAFPAPNATQAS